MMGVGPRQVFGFSSPEIVVIPRTISHLAWSDPEVTPPRGDREVMRGPTPRWRSSSAHPTFQLHEYGVVNKFTNSRFDILISRGDATVKAAPGLFL